MNFLKNTAIIFIFIFGLLTVGIFQLMFKDVFHHYFNEWLNNKNQEELIKEAEYKINKDNPKRLDNYTVNTKTHIDEKTRTFYFQMSLLGVDNNFIIINNSNIAEVERKLTAKVVSNYCQILTVNPLVKKGYMFAYAYKYIDEKGDFKILNIVASPQDC